MNYISQGLLHLLLVCQNSENHNHVVKKQHKDPTVMDSAVGTKKTEPQTKALTTNPRSVDSHSFVHKSGFACFAEHVVVEVLHSIF